MKPAADRTRRTRSAPAGVLCALALLTFSFALPAGAQVEPGPEATKLQEEDDFRETPYTEYGDFDSDQDEADDARFFQYGRFFGVSLGTGFHGVTGKRGLLWQGGFPMINLRVHTWFDFNLALMLGLHTASHFYDKDNKDNIVDVSLFSLDLHMKYYFPTQNMTAAISFASPYLTVGMMGLTKTETEPDADGAIVKHNTIGFGAGAGVEFTVSPKKTYLFFEGMLYYAGYEDTRFTTFANSHGISDLTGAFYTMSANILVTW